MQQTKEDLILAAAAVARSTPDTWATFMQALSGHLDEQKENLMNSPSDKLEHFQGRAQAVSALIKVFDACKENAEKITNARKARS